MAKISIVTGSTSKLLDIFIQDSSSTVGAGLTGLVFNTGSLTGYYYREGAASASVISLQTMTLGTWATGGFIVVDGTNMPGCYQLGIPDAALAAGAKSVLVMLKGASNMAQLVLEVELTAVNNQSATAFITGVNSLAPPTNWNLASIDASGRLDIIKVAGTTQTARDLGASVLLSTGTGTGQLDFTSGVVKANATQWLGGTIPAVSVTGVPLVDLKYTLGTISPATAGSVRADTVTGAVGSVTGAVGSVTGAVGSVTGAVGSVTGNVGGNVTGTVGSVVGAVGSVTGNVGGSVASVVGAVGSVTADVGITQAGADKAWSTAVRALTDKANFTLSAAYDPAKTAAQAGDAMSITTGGADVVITRTLGTESYAADGAVPTLAQSLFQILSALTEFAIAGTTITCKKLDGSATSMTFTLDDATNPTSRTRAT